MSDLHEYIPIQKLDLEGNVEVPFDLYIHLSKNQKLLLYRRQGWVIDEGRIEKLHDQDTILLVHRNDYLKFVTYVSERIGKLLNISPENDPGEILGSVVRGLLTQTFHSDDAALTRALMNNVNEVASLLIGRVLDEFSSHGKRTFRRMIALAASGTDFQKHPVNVASLCTMMCFGSGLASKKTLAEVSVACLVHDLGLTKLPLNLANKAMELKPELTPHELIHLNRHVMYTFSVLEERQFEISELSRQMIAQHHEYFNGTGFPLGLYEGEVNIFAQILHMADEIDHVVFGAKSQKPQVDLFNLFETWAAGKFFDPLLVSRMKTLFFAGSALQSS